MTTFPLPHPGRTALDLAAYVAAFFVRAEPRRPHDDEIAHYGTQTFRVGTNGLVLVAQTPEVTYGELRGKA